MADTANYAWTKPTVGGDTGTWGTVLNTALDDIDTDVQAVEDKADDGIGYFLGVFYHVSAGQPISDNSNWQLTSGSLSPGATLTNVDWDQAIPLRVGQTLASVTARVYRDTNASVTLKVFRVQADGTRTQLGSTATSASTGWHGLVVSSLAHVVLTANHYYAEIGLTSDSSSATSARCQGIVAA